MTVDTENATAPMTYILVICVGAENRSSPGGLLAMKAVELDASAMMLRFQHCQSETGKGEHFSKIFLGTRLATLSSLYIPNRNHSLHSARLGPLDGLPMHVTLRNAPM